MKPCTWLNVPLDCETRIFVAVGFHSLCRENKNGSVHCGIDYSISKPANVCPLMSVWAGAQGRVYSGKSPVRTL